MAGSAIPPTLSSRDAAAFKLLLRRVSDAFLIEALDVTWGGAGAYAAAAAAAEARAILIGFSKISLFCFSRRGNNDLCSRQNRLYKSNASPPFHRSVDACCRLLATPSGSSLPRQRASL